MKAINDRGRTEFCGKERLDPGFFRKIGFDNNVIVFRDPLGRFRFDWRPDPKNYLVSTVFTDVEAQQLTDVGENQLGIGVGRIFSDDLSENSTEPTSSSSDEDDLPGVVTVSVCSDRHFDRRAIV